MIKRSSVKRKEVKGVMYLTSMNKIRGVTYDTICVNVNPSGWALQDLLFHPFFCGQQNSFVSLDV